MSRSLQLSILVFILLGLSSAQLFDQFDYEQQGNDWDYSDCTTLIPRRVVNLSPLDLLTNTTFNYPYYYYFFSNYSSTQADVTYYNITLELNASTAFGQAQTVTAGFMVGTFEAISLRLHSEAEHTFNGTRYPVELQIYHQLIDSLEPANAYQANLFVSVFFDNSTDAASNDLLANITQALISNATTADIDLSYLFDLTSTRDEVYSYAGTQTIPPCSPTSWLVFPNPFHASSEQIQMIYDLYHNNPNFYGQGNYRATQNFEGEKYYLLNNLNAAQHATPSTSME